MKQFFDIILVLSIIIELLTLLKLVYQINKLHQTNLNHSIYYNHLMQRKVKIIIAIIIILIITCLINHTLAFINLIVAFNLFNKPKLYLDSILIITPDAFILNQKPYLDAYLKAYKQLDKLDNLKSKQAQKQAKKGVALCLQYGEHQDWIYLKDTKQLTALINKFQQINIPTF